MNIRTLIILAVTFITSLTLHAQSNGITFASGPFTNYGTNQPVNQPTLDALTTSAISRIVVELGWTELGVGAILFVVLQFISALWIKARLEGSIQFEYSKLLKDYEFTQKKKEESVKIAALLARRCYPQDQSKRDLASDIWALSLWLSPPLVCHLTEFLAGTNPAYTDPKNLLIMLRKELHGRADSLEACQIAHIEIINDSTPRA